MFHVLLKYGYKKSRKSPTLDITNKLCTKPQEKNLLSSVDDWGVCVSEGFRDRPPDSMFVPSSLLKPAAIKRL
jgi:hypothetical protein